MDWQPIIDELKERFMRDQRRQTSSLVDENAQWLAKIINKHGWPAAEQVGEPAELHAWLIAQHATSLAFQKQCLKILQDLPRTQARAQHIAYLQDRILMKEERAQIYGTQCVEQGGVMVTYWVDHPESLNQRREEIGLEPVEKYLERINKS